MNLAEALLPLLPGKAGVVAFVGAGGKTTALFRLARELAPRPVLLTTTTHLADPRPCPDARIVFAPALEGPFDGGPVPAAGAPGLTILLAREADAPGKVKGIHPSWIPALRASWDLILVEADGSRRLPVKAPAEHEPVLPPGTDLVAGVIGLDCLGRPMDGATVHRPELFGAVTGCGSGQPIGWAHLAALAAHPRGLFKCATGRRALLLNKADTLPAPPSLDGFRADRVLLCSLEAPDGVILVEEGAP
jgi:probable selenium-dependent hydroxylase accessory protein YqeC